MHYQCDDLIIDTHNKLLTGKVAVNITNNGSTAIDTLTILHWANAYNQNKSHLAVEMLQDQNASLHFAYYEESGQTFIQFQSSELLPKDRLLDEEQKLFINLKPGADTILIYTLAYQLPETRFNGYGFNDASIQLSHWLPRIAKIDSSNIITYNSRNREAWFYPATYDLTLTFNDTASLVSNLQVSRTNQFGNRYNLTTETPEDDALIILLKHGSTLPVEEPGKEINIHFTGDYPAFNTLTSWGNITAFLNKELGWEPDDTMHIVALEQKKGLQSAGNCLLVEKTEKQDDLEGEIIDEIVQVYAREVLGVNPAAHPFMVAGLGNYYKHLYFNRYYPNKMLLGPFSKTFVARFFDVDHYPISYQNRMLYLYMVRQGLDQPLSDPASEFPRFNREAVINGKSSLWYSYMRSYVGEKNFLRGMRRWAEIGDGTPESLIAALRYYHNRDLSWLLNDVYTTAKKLDYKLVKTENCTSVYTATVKNKGSISTPYSITGYKDGKPVLTEWFDGHEGKKTVQIHLEDYDEVRLDAAEAMPEYRQKNNAVRTSGIFKNMKPLKLQFYTSFENPDRTQIFWLPSVKYNAYDQLLLGASFYNTNLFRKPFEYRIAPDYSTGTGKLTGLGSFRFNFTPDAGPFHLISFGLYGRYYHYAPDLAYTRLSPTLTLNFRKPYPRSEWIQSLRLRAVGVDRETPVSEPGAEDPPIEGPANYQIVDLRYRAEKGSLLTPFILNFDAQFAEDFVKFSVDIKQRWRFSKHHILTARFFSGILGETKNNSVDPFFQFGVSGTRDYLFDYYFIGRSDQDGIWSQQLFVTDGGFKGQTNRFTNGLTAVNLNVPFFRFIGAFGDVAFLYKSNGRDIYYDYGLYLEFIPDFIEIYFPFQINDNFVLDQPEYYRQIRFVLNLELDAIVNRVRRGWY